MMNQFAEFPISSEGQKLLLEYLQSAMRAFGVGIQFRSAERREELLRQLNAGYPLVLSLQMLPSVVLSCMVARPDGGDPEELFRIPIQFAPSITPGQLLH
jgi:hypothetical protein